MTATSPQGAVATVYDLRPGGIFGHVAAILGQEFSAALQLVADDGGDLFELSRTDFLALSHEIPEVDQATTKALAALAKHYAEQVFDLSVLPGRARVVGELLRLSRHAKGEGSGQKSVPATTHATLAARVGASREFVSRCLKDLEAQGLIKTRRGGIDLLDLKNLRAIDLRLAGIRINDAAEGDQHK